MKFFFVLFTIFTLGLCATCPSMCSGHGSCTMSGTCNCFEGYTYGDCSGRKCAYGNIYVNPDSDSTKNDKTENSRYLECSGKGNCNRNSGICECYDGFEGDACDRVSCPNSCSGHGLCVPVKHLKLDANSDGSAKYQNSYSEVKVTTGVYSVERKDADQSYACVCDGEYTGYDCSEKKCVSGYSVTSDCAESSSTSTQTFTVTIGVENGDDANNAYKCLAYLEYTDMLGRKWYSDRFCTYCQEKGIPAGADACSQNGILGWNEALHRLPVGVIDSNTVAKCTDPTTPCTEVEITFGNQQTGRQNPLKLITNKVLTDALTKDQYPGGDNPSGYHGMSTTDLPASSANTQPPAIKIDTKYYVSVDSAGAEATSTGMKPSECAGNGLCNTETGLCECFTGFYGIACTMTEDMM